MEEGTHEPEACTVLLTSEMTFPQNIQFYADMQNNRVTFILYHSLHFKLSNSCG